MIIEQIPIGNMANFGYILGCEETKVGALIDPAFEPEKLILRAKELELDIEWILNTHGHFDHIEGNEVAVKMTGAKIIAHRNAMFYTDLKVDNSNLKGISINNATNILTAKSPKDKVTHGIPVA